MLNLILIASMLLNIIQAIFHFFERRDMLNRIMCDSFTEYKNIGKPPEHIPSAHSKVLNRWRNKAGDR